MPCSATTSPAARRPRIINARPTVRVLTGAIRTAKTVTTKMTCRDDEWSNDQSRGWREVDCERPEPTRPPDNSEESQTRLHHALAVGCQAVAWWLRRQAGRVTAFATLGIGLVASGVAFVAGIGLAQSALHLLSLADAMRSSTQALASLS